MVARGSSTRFSGSVSVPLSRAHPYFNIPPEGDMQIAAWTAFPSVRAPLPTPKIGEYVSVYGIREAVVVEVHPETCPPYYVAKGVVTTRPPYIPAQGPVPESVQMTAEIWEEYTP